ncbi:RNA polymerase sigma-70 factor [Saccharicrinis aurantiacus]|uniref:RNA polymerase sigma-70 factor n=1 Tax=Saccharicrinis aurantiacus TaxID=1849719 RepID=UPI0024918FCD|nr:RNA polymerase sigma-70 factor [Saccharicrinis aurantiacus]
MLICVNISIDSLISHLFLDMHLVPFKIDLVSLKRGNKHAYEAIYFEFYDVLYHLALQYLNNQQHAQEIVQDAFLKLWEIRESINDNTNIRNFLYTIVKNNSLNFIRNKQTAIRHYDIIQHHELEMQYQSLQRIGDEVMIADELQIKIEAALDKLPEEVRTVFEMSRFEDLKNAEIADKLGISKKTVEARMTRALKHLKLELKDYLLLFPLIWQQLS